MEVIDLEAYRKIKISESDSSEVHPVKIKISGLGDLEIYRTKIKISELEKEIVRILEDYEPPESLGEIITETYQLLTGEKVKRKENKNARQNYDLDCQGYLLLYYDPKNVLGLISRALGSSDSPYSRDKSMEYLKEALEIDPQNRVVVCSALYLATQHRQHVTYSLERDRLFSLIDSGNELFGNNESVLENTLRLALHLANWGIEDRIKATFDNLKRVSPEKAEKYREVVEVYVKPTQNLRLVR
ncbi:MAG: hypothetical protein KKA62_03970 [Nanoarchaeota archaeon]|nr:hypothetical protein [Nanoarchaeota archaeon]MBU1643985.1 hypothetical protein [Nanoarchaeota archaeon]MBU1977080.1 hypothetical protein [Nanoarchaeota archaeon]